MSRQLTATAQINVTVQVTVGSWGPSCTVQQITEQAKKEAVSKVKRAIANQSELRTLGNETVSSIVLHEAAK